MEKGVCMESKLQHLLKGYVRVRITGNAYDRFLNLCAHHGIVLWDLVPVGESYEASMTKEDFLKLRPLIRKSHTRVRILQRHGFPFFLHRYRKRKAWVLGIAAAALLMFWLSSHVWLITIDGNVSQTDDVLFEYLDSIGIRHGIAKKEIDCHALAAQIRNAFSEFTWVSAKLNGTRLDLEVREGAFREETADDGSDEPSDLVASEAGTVVSILVRSGLPQVQAGDEVEEGTVLVSGTLPIYNDDGEVKSYQYTAADADIVIRTTMEYQEQIPYSIQVKEYTGESKKGLLLRVGGASFGIGSLSNTYEYGDVTQKITQARLSENFYLPLYAGWLTVREYIWKEKIRTQEELEAIAEENFQQFLKKIDEKGLLLFENNVRIEWYEKFCTVSGSLVVGKEAVRREALQNESQEDMTDE